jgi:hypothetical protein
MELRICRIDRIGVLKVVPEDDLDGSFDARRHCRRNCYGMNSTQDVANARPLFSLICLLFVCAGCDEYHGLANQVRNAATAQQWQAWAVQVLERSKTNSVPPPRSEWPAFVGRLSPPCSDWELWIGRNGSTSNIALVSVGGFGSFGVDIGPATFVEPAIPSERCQQVYPGVYVVHN